MKASQSSELIEDLPFGVVLFDSSSRVIFYNSRAEKILGKKQTYGSELLWDSEILDLPFFIQDLRDVLTSRQPVERLLRTQDRREIQCKISPNKGGGELLLNDVTTLSLSQSGTMGEATLEELMKLAMDQVITLDRTGVILEVNFTFSQHEPSQVVGSNFLNGLSQEHREEFKALMAQVFHTGKALSWDYETEISSEFVAYSCTLNPLLRQRRIYAISLIRRDVTELVKQANAIAESQERLSLALDGGNIGVWEWDFRKGRIKCDTEMSIIHGWPQRDEITIDDFKEGIWEEDLAVFEASITDSIENHSPIDVEYRVKHEEEIRFIRNRARVFRNLKGKPVKVFGTCVNITSQKQMELEQANAIILAQESERERLGSELHDGIGQLLTAARLNISSVMQRASGLTEDQVILLQKAKDQVDQALNDARNISHKLIPGTLYHGGLNRALSELCEGVPISDQLVIFFEEKEIGNRRFEEVIELYLYRIAQELITNAIKHAGASEIYVLLELNENRLTLEVRDDGKGFREEELSLSEGLGLHNINSRVELLNGHFSCFSVPGRGSRFMVECQMDTVEKLTEEHD